MSPDKEARAIISICRGRRNSPARRPSATAAHAAAAAQNKTPAPIIAALASGLLIAMPCGAVAGEQRLGAYLAGECTTCHRLGAAQENIPPIFGLPESVFVAAMQAYRSGAREASVMRSVAISLSDREIRALARYFGTSEAQP